VRGVSETTPCAGSERDCRLIDDVSVLLLLSAIVRLGGFVRRDSAGATDVALPVMRRFLNAFTSIDARGALFSICDGSTGSLRCPCGCDDRHGSSIVANVLVNGVGGIPGSVLVLSADSDIRSVSVLCASSSLLTASNGSAPSVAICANCDCRCGTEGSSL
jgi:hypothetical protein